MEGILAPWHWIIIIAVILLIFGPKKLPELGNSLGRSITGFKKGLKDVQEELHTPMAEAAAPEPAALGGPVMDQSSAAAENEPKPQA